MMTMNLTASAAAVVSALAVALAGACSESGKGGSGDFGGGTGTASGSMSGTSGDGAATDSSDTLPPLPGCANGVVEDAEECDDGNQVNGDGCNKDCTVGTDTTLWEQTHNGEASGDDLGNGIAVDSADSIVAIGGEVVTDEGRNAWIRKYDVDGEEQWTTTFNGPDGGDDMGRAVAIGDADSVLACGHSTDAGGDTAMWVAKYDADGAEVWTQSFPGNCNSIASDGSTGAVITGRAPEAVGDRDDVWVAMLDTDGAAVWEQVFGAEDRIDQGKDVAVDGDGNILVVGTLSVAGESGNAWVAKLASDGMELWSDTIDGPDGSDDSAQAVAVDANGEAVVAGYVSEGGVRLAYVATYDAGGSVLESWTTAHVTSPDADLRGEDVTFAANGDVIVAGSIVSAVQNEETNWWVRRYEPDGTGVWTQTTDLSGPDEANGVAMAGSGDIAVIGTFKHLTEAKNITVRLLAPE